MSSRQPLIDLFGITEEERILVIGSRAMHETIGLLMERNEPEKVARYIQKVTEQFPGVRHIETIDGPSPLIVQVRFGPTAEQARKAPFRNRAPIVDQLEGHWERIAYMLVWKLTGGAVTITQKDMERCIQETEGKTFLTYGHSDSIEFKFVTKEEADRIVEYQKSQQGHA